MLLTGEFNGHSGQDMGLPSDAYKRAVLRAPPSRFSVEFLPHLKSSGSYNHGMRISPVAFSDDVSVSSRGRNVEYEIWRRWEDCLWLQETLESEYQIAAREKKVRLQQGKGVKTYNGMYKQDMASSWESLPPGPDPNSVAQDIHQYLPKLSKKGTLFRASQATIDNRQKEFRTLVETLFSDSMPALIQEIRASSTITNFFGFWRRDYDAFEAANKGRRNSVTSSVFSSYFSESNPSISSKSPKSSVRSSSTSSTQRNRVSSVSSSSSDVSEYTYNRRSSVRSNDTHRPRRRPSSVTSSDSSSTNSDGSSDSRSTASTDPAIVDDAPILFDHDPQQSATDRPNSILEILPEEREMLAKTEALRPFPVQRRPRASLMERKANRNFSIIGLPLESCDENTSVHHRSVRESWQTTASMDSNAEAFLEGLNLSLPHKIKDQKFRASIASISTFMTTDSADAVVPRSESPSTPPSPTPTARNRKTLSRLRISTPLSLSDFEIYSDVDDEVDFENNDLSSIRDCDSILNAFPRPTSYLPPNYNQSHSDASECDSRPQTPTTATSYDSSDAPVTPDSARSTFTVNYNPPPSPTSSISTAFTAFSMFSDTSMTSTFTTSTMSSTSPGTISLKAAYKSSIILLRVPRETPFKDVRQRLYNKFIGQEGVPLSHDFSVAVVPPNSSGSASAHTSPIKSKSRSVRSRAESASSSASERMDIVFIESEAHWERIVSPMTAGKISLRIFDCEISQ